MNPESDFRIESTYDRQAYQAMAKATWKLFQKHRMEVMAYPALISVALVIAVLLVFNWNHTVLPIRILGIAFIVLQFAVIPLGARRAQAKTCRKAIRDAEKRGEYPVPSSQICKFVTLLKIYVCISRKRCYNKHRKNKKHFLDG